MANGPKYNAKEGKWILDPYKSKSGFNSKQQSNSLPWNNLVTRIFMTAGVSVANGHTEQGHKLKSGLKSSQQGKKAFTSAADPSDLRPLSGVMGSDVGGLLAGDERRKQSDDSLRQVMYMNCWGPS